MSPELSKAIKQLRDVLQNESHEHCVSVSVFFNSEGYEIQYNTRTPSSLLRDGISMRNIKGDFIKPKETT